MSEEGEQVQLDENEDEFKRNFDELDRSQESNDQKLHDYLLLLKNARLDDVAIKVKEQCIYRFFL